MLFKDFLYEPLITDERPKNKAVYTALLVECDWAKAVISFCTPQTGKSAIKNRRNQ